MHALFSMNLSLNLILESENFHLKFSTGSLKNHSELSATPKAQFLEQRGLGHNLSQLFDVGRVPFGTA